MTLLGGRVRCDAQAHRSTGPECIKPMLSYRGRRAARAKPSVKLVILHGRWRARTYIRVDKGSRHFQQWFREAHMSSFETSCCLKIGCGVMSFLPEPRTREGNLRKYPAPGNMAGADERPRAVFPDGRSHGRPALNEDHISARHVETRTRLEPGPCAQRRGATTLLTDPLTKSSFSLSSSSAVPPSSEPMSPRAALRALPCATSVRP